MLYIDSYELDATDFNVFCRARAEGLGPLKCANDVAIKYVATPHEVPGVSVLWLELIDVLPQDPRFDQLTMFN